MPRRLLNIASIVCLVLCVALMGMWVRSYFWLDDFKFKPFGASSIGVASSSDRIAIGTMSAALNPNEGLINFTHTPISDWRSDLAKIDQRFSTIAGFGLVHDNNVFVFMVPYWFAVLIAGALSIAYWPRVKYRFSLRTLFIATTFLAVVLGMIAWLDRAWIGK
jgi:hypothetical protein